MQHFIKMPIVALMMSMVVVPQQQQPNHQKNARTSRNTAQLSPLTLDSHGAEIHHQRKHFICWDLWRMIYEYMSNDAQAACAWGLTCTSHYRHFQSHFRPKHGHLLRSILKNQVAAVRYLLWKSPFASKWKLDPNVNDGIVFKELFKPENLDMLKVLFDPTYLEWRRKLEVGQEYKLPESQLRTLFERWRFNRDASDYINLMAWIIQDSPINAHHYVHIALCDLCTYGRLEPLKLFMTIITPGCRFIKELHAALQCAIENNRGQTVRFLLQDDRIDPSHDNNRALQYAVVNDNIEALILLLQYPSVQKQLKPHERQKYEHLMI